MSFPRVNLFNKLLSAINEPIHKGIFNIKYLADSLLKASELILDLFCQLADQSKTAISMIVVATFASLFTAAQCFKVAIFVGAEFLYDVA
jgi:hypothetical protein